jgi:hypothetical protein
MKVSRTYSGYGRLGRDWHGGGLFFRDPVSASTLGSLLKEAIREDTELSGDEIHDFTCGVTDMRPGGLSITGDGYLAKKAMRYKIRIEVEAELVDDRLADSKELKELKLRSGGWGSSDEEMEEFKAYLKAHPRKDDE